MTTKKININEEVTRLFILGLSLFFFGDESEQCRARDCIAAAKDLQRLSSKFNTIQYNNCIS